MGGIGQALFGGSSSKQSSSSSNQAYDYLKGTLGGNVSTGNNAMGSIAALLGQGGDAGASDAAFQNYLGSTGHQFMLDQGSKAITGNKAASGMLKSGSTLKALTSFGQNLGSQGFNNYLTQLQGLVGSGLQSAGLIGGAGQVSTSTGKSSSQNGIIPGLFS